MRLAILSVALLVPLVAQAQLPAVPDAKAYPELFAMKRWLEGGSPEAKHCALSGGLFAEASDLYRKTRSEERTVEAVVLAHGDKLPAGQRERFSTIVANVTSLAAAFVGMDEGSAAAAFLRICMGRAQRPGVVAAPNIVRAQFDAALRCEKLHGAGSLERKECVATAFQTP